MDKRSSMNKIRSLFFRSLRNLGFILLMASALIFIVQFNQLKLDRRASGRYNMNGQYETDQLEKIDDPRMGSLSLPPGVRLYEEKKRPYVIKPDADGAVAETIYESIMKEVHVECRERIKFGGVDEGGWDMCVAGPYRPSRDCLVYSFGINFDWSFDEAISEEFDCDVKAFDPSMDMTAHQHSGRVMFYPIGLGATNDRKQEKKKQEWDMLTLGTLLEKFGDNNKIIDYLKMDIEYYEWEVLSAVFKENILPRVKQIGFEAHTRVVRKASKLQTTTEEYLHHVTIIRELESLGFRKWYSHQNPAGLHFSERNKKYRSCCYELVYINMNFLKSS